MIMELWVVSCHNVSDTGINTIIHGSYTDARVEFEKAATAAIELAMDELGDFRVSKNANSITILDEEDSVMITCEITKHTIACGTMCM